MLQLPLFLIFFIYSSFSVVEAARFAQWSGMPEGGSDWTSFFGQSGTSTSLSTSGTPTTNSTQLLVQATATVIATSTHVATQTLFIHGNSTSSTSTLKGNTSQPVTETTRRTTSFVTVTSPAVTTSKSFATIAPALVTNPPASDTSHPSSPAVGAISDSGLSSIKIGIIVVSSIVALLIIPIALLLRRRYKHKTSGFIADLMVRQHPSRVISPFVPSNVEAELTSPTAPSMQERQEDTFMPNFTFVSEKHRIALDNALGRGAHSEMGTTTVSEKQHRMAFEDALTEQEGNDIEATVADHTQRRTLGSTTSTARQIILQNQADSIRERIQVLQQTSNPDSVQELDRLEMTLRDILDQMESDWALGLTDDPPPMYYYQTPPPSARFAPTISSGAPSRPPSPPIRSLPPIPPTVRIHPPSVQSSGNVYTYL